MSEDLYAKFWICQLPRGGCGLKFLNTVNPLWLWRQLPRGGCGLKYTQNRLAGRQPPSASARGLWIEISPLIKVSLNSAVSFREGAVD